MKYYEAARILWLEKEIQILSNPSSYLHKEKWQLGKKKEKHALSDRLTTASNKLGEVQSEENLKEVVALISELREASPV